MIKETPSYLLCILTYSTVSYALALRQNTGVFAFAELSTEHSENIG